MEEEETSSSSLSTTSSTLSWSPSTWSSSESPTSSLSSTLSSASSSSSVSTSTPSWSWSSSSWLPLSSSTTTSSSLSSSTLTSSAATSTSSTSQNPRRRGAILDGEVRQMFSLPESIICYIAMNPSNAEVYKKLIQTCKYFYNKNPILVVNQICFAPNDIYFEENLKFHEGKSNESNEHELDPNFPYDHDWKVTFTKSNGYHNYPKIIIDMKNIPFKLWIRDRIDIHTFDDSRTNIAASIIPKIYQCEAYALSLEHQVITLDQFLFLGSNAKDVELDWTKITENDGKTEVFFEKIIKCLPKIQELSVHFVNESNCISSETVKELLKLQQFGNIFDLHLTDIPRIFDIKTLFAHIKTYKNINVSLFYRHELSGQYKQQVDEIIDEIITTKNFNFKPPRIVYPGLDDSKKKKIEKLHNRYCNKRF